MKHEITRSLRSIIRTLSFYDFVSYVRSLQEIYNAANDIRSAIPHPRIMGVIKECGGKMWMGERM